MPKRHDDQTLLNAIEHIMYEIRMFVDLTFTEMRYPLPVQFSILEAWLIHLRGIDGMLQKRRYPTDVLLSDFANVAIGELIDDFTRDRINRELAHITILRLAGGPEKAWNRVEIFRQAWPGIEKIIDVLIAWVNTHQPASPRKPELVDLRAHGSLLHAVATSGALLENVKGGEEADMPHLAVTHTYGYPPESRSDSNNRNNPFL